MALMGILISYILLSDHIIPAIQKGDQISPFELFGRIVLPMGVFVLLIFYIVFELFLNIFAEITRFGDREFY